MLLCGCKALLPAEGLWAGMTQRDDAANDDSGESHDGDDGSGSNVAGKDEGREVPGQVAIICQARDLHVATLLWTSQGLRSEYSLRLAVISACRVLLRRVNLTTLPQ